MNGRVGCVTALSDLDQRNIDLDQRSQAHEERASLGQRCIVQLDPLDPLGVTLSAGEAPPVAEKVKVKTSHLRPVDRELEGTSQGGEPSEAQAVALASDRLKEDMGRILAQLFSNKPPAPSPPLPPPPPRLAHPLELVEATSSGSAENSAPSEGLLAPGDRDRLLGMLESDEGREALVHALNQQRSKRTEIGALGFVDLACAVGQVLDRCRDQQDVHLAKMTMMLSQTFYKLVPAVPVAPALTDTEPAEADRSEAPVAREYLKSALLKNPLWEDISFWDEACWQVFSMRAFADFAHPASASLT